MSVFESIVYFDDFWNCQSIVLRSTSKRDEKVKFKKFLIFLKSVLI